MSQWHCTINGRKYGPVSAQDLHNWLAEGRLRPTDHVWTDGMDDWAPCNTVEEFNRHTPPQQSNRKAKASMVLGIVSLPAVIVTLPPMYFSLFTLMLPVACVFVCLWICGVACAIVGVCLGVAGRRQAIKANGGEGAAIAGISLGCITLIVVTAEIILIRMLWAWAAS